jgi:hypothetical protein
MGRTCITENEGRFSQTENTPPMTAPLFADLGKYGKTEEAQAILAGLNKCPPDIDPYAKEFISSLQRLQIVSDQGPVTTELTLIEHSQGWKRQ